MIYSPAPGMRKYIILADGENLVRRYQDMAPQETPNGHAVHIQDVLVWHSSIASVQGWTPLRVNYYTSVVGTEDHIATIETKISEIVIQRQGETPCQMCPKVFKRPKQINKTKIVDVSLAIDALRHSYHAHVEAIMLLSGDGDYLPLIEELMRNGTQVWLGAFSSGLNSSLPSAVDKFIDLDSRFFTVKQKPSSLS